MDNELHNRSVFLFWLLFGSNALDLKKTSWLLQWTIFRRRSQLEDIDSPILRCLIAKIASSLKKVIQNSNFKKRVHLEEQKAQFDDRFLRGSSLCMIYECFHVTEDRFRRSFKGEDVQEFDTRWDDVSLSIRKVPSDDILARLYKMRIRGSDQLKIVLVCL